MKETYTVQVNNRSAALKILDQDHSPNEIFNVSERAILTAAREVLGNASK